MNNTLQNTRTILMDVFHWVWVSHLHALLLARLMGQYCFALWRLLASVVVCNTAGRQASQPTLHGGPVVLRPVRATPCFISFVLNFCFLLEQMRTLHTILTLWSHPISIIHSTYITDPLLIILYFTFPHCLNLPFLISRLSVPTVFFSSAF